MSGYLVFRGFDLLLHIKGGKSQAHNCKKTCARAAFVPAVYYNWGFVTIGEGNRKCGFYVAELTIR